MKFRAPENCGGANVRGVEIIVGEDGGAEVPDHLAADLAAHGFSAWVEPAPVEKIVVKEVVKDEDPNEIPDENAIKDAFDGMNRGALFAWLKAAGFSVAPPINNADLRVKCREAKALADAASSPASADAPPVQPSV